MMTYIESFISDTRCKKYNHKNYKPELPEEQNRIISMNPTPKYAGWIHTGIQITFEIDYDDCIMTSELKTNRNLVAVKAYVVEHL